MWGLLTQSMNDHQGTHTVHGGEHVLGCPVTLEHVLPHIEGVVPVVCKEVRMSIPVWGGGRGRGKGKEEGRVEGRERRRGRRGEEGEERRGEEWRRREEEGWEEGREEEGRGEGEDNEVKMDSIN